MSNDITCTSLKIVDSKGNVRIAIGIDRNDNARIVLTSSDNSSNEPTIVLTSGTTNAAFGANIQIRDTNGDSKVVLQTVKDEGYIVVSGQLIDSHDKDTDLYLYGLTQ